MGAKRILIHDPDLKLVADLKDHILANRRAFDVITTADGQEALEIIRRLPVDLFLTGLQGRILDGYQLLTEVGRNHPKVKIIVMISQGALLPRAAFRYLGAKAMFEKPVNLTEITDAVFAHLQVRRTGEVWGVNLTSFLQMLNADLKTCILNVTRPGEAGRIYIEEGNIVTAECGSQVGDDALYTILAWDDPIIEIEYTAFTKWRTISAGLMSMLMESQRRKDNELMEKVQSRRHARFRCLVAVDFDSAFGKLQHLIRDLSEGGAYIETGAKLELGSEFELNLYSMRKKQECRLRAQVVRRGSNGFGVRFLNLNEYQRTFIVSLRED